MLEALMNQPTEYGDTPPPDSNEGCPDEYGTPITAPKANLWRSMSGEETAAVVEWLFAQEDLNLTLSSEAGEWDNQMYVFFLRMAVIADGVLTQEFQSSTGYYAPKQNRRPGIS
jgi:hypothetical protein